MSIESDPEGPANPSGEPKTEPGEELSSPPSRSRRWPAIVTIVMLSLGVVALGAGYVYSTNSADQWRATANKATADLASSTKQRDDLQTKAASLTSELSDMTSQYNQANDRIRSLANEKAQAGDRAAAAAQNAAAAGQLLDLSQRFAGEMSTCIRDLKTLQSYLVNYRAYDQTVLLAAVQTVNAECNKAQSDSDRLANALRSAGL